MKISVVTISFNQARFLRECIESVLNQNYPEIEYIVVDAGSTDESRTIICEYRHRIDKVIFENDEGPADGLNKGFLHASGDIFFYLNADDVLVDGSFAKAVALFNRHYECDVLCGQVLEIDEIGVPNRKLYPSIRWSAYRYALGTANAPQQGTFFRSSAFHATAGFNAQNKTCWDGELLVDMALQEARVCCVREVLGCFRIYADSISGSGRLEKPYLADQSRIQEKILSSGSFKREYTPVWFMRLMNRVTHFYPSVSRKTVEPSGGG